MCKTKLVVFYPGTGDPTVLVPMPFLGFQKITKVGVYVVYCADGYDPSKFPSGWLYAYESEETHLYENANNIKVAKDAEDTGIIPGDEEFSSGWNPWGLINVNLPWWVWIAVAAFLFYELKD